MLFGSIAAIAGGVATPVSFLFFGDVITAFTYYALTSNLSTELFGVSVGCDNATLSFVVRNLSTEQNALSCVDEDALVRMINTSIYSFIGLALGTFLASYVQIFFFQTACERQLYKIRLYYYRAILRQDIGWFDGNPSGELASRLSELSTVGVGRGGWEREGGGWERVGEEGEGWAREGGGGRGRRVREGREDV